MQLVVYWVVVLRSNNHSKAPTTVELPPLGRNALQCSQHKRTHDWLKSDRNSGRTPEGSRYRTLLCMEGVGRFLLLLLPQCFLDGGWLCAELPRRIARLVPLIVFV